MSTDSAATRPAAAAAAPQPGTQQQMRSVLYVDS